MTIEEHRVKPSWGGSFSNSGLLERFHFSNNIVNLRENLTFIVNGNSTLIDDFSLFLTIEDHSTINTTVDIEKTTFGRNTYEKVTKFINKFNLSGYGHVWINFDYKIALLRYNFVRTIKRHPPFLEHQYGLYILSEKIEDIQLVLQFSLEYSLISKFYRFGPTIPLIENGSTEEQFGIAIFYYGKHPILFRTHKEYKPEFMKWNLKKNSIAQLSYNFDIKKLYFDDFYQKNTLPCQFQITYNEEYPIPRYNGFDFKISKEDWKSLLGIIPIDLSEKIISYHTPIFRINHTYPKIHFKEESLGIIEYRDITKTPQYSELKFKNLDKLNYDLSALVNVSQKFYTLFILNDKNPKLDLLCLPFIKYFSGKPIFYSKDPQEYNLADQRHSFHFFFFIGFQPNRQNYDYIQSYLKNNFPNSIEPEKRIIVITSTSLINVSLTINTLYSKILAVDSLLSSHTLLKNYFYHEIKFMGEDTGLIVNDIVKNLPIDFRKKIPNALETLSEEEFNLIRDDLFLEVNNSVLKELLSIGNILLGNFSLQQNNKKETNLTIPRNREIYNFAFISINSELNYFMGASIFCGYRGFFLYIIDTNKIQSQLSEIKNLNNKISNDYKNAKYDEVKKKLSRYSNIISPILDKKIKEFINEISIFTIGNIEKKANFGTEFEHFFGNIVFFVPFDELFYESLNLNDDFPLRYYYSIGRFPLDNSVRIDQIVNESFLQFEKFPNRFSIGILFYNILLNNPEYSKFSEKSIKKILSMYDEIGFPTKMLMDVPNSENEKIVNLINESSLFLYFGHGKTSSLELGDQSTLGNINHLEIKTKPGKLGVLIACQSGFAQKNEELINFASELLVNSFSGILASFWKVQSDTAIYLTLNILTKIIHNYSISSIITFYRRFHFTSQKGFFGELFIFYGDPTYRIYEFYKSEINKFEKTGIEKEILKKNPF